MKFIFSSILSLALCVSAQAQLNQQWLNRYNAAGDYSDKAKDLVVNSGGNVFITGYTTTNGNHDYITMKLTSAGDTLWTRTYNGVGNGEDEANAIAIDGSGNVYVTGYARGDGTGDDIVTIKYNSIGVEQWIKVTGTDYMQDDEGRDIAVDANGNVYVTGVMGIDAAGLNTDFITLKINSAGITQWWNSYVGPGNSLDRSDKIVLDNAGNPIVTGRVYNGDDDDWYTAKYNTANGTVVWSNIADYTKNDRPGDMTIDASNNVYVTGRTKSTNYDIATRKIDASGNTVWTKFYQGVDDDRGTAVAVDASGNVYVTGLSDANANVLFEDYNVVTLKYNSAGTQQWVKAYAGDIGNDYSERIAVNANGDVLVAGSTTVDAVSGENTDYLVLKYANDGTLTYTKIFDGGVNGNDEASALGLVNNEAVVSGGAYTAANNKDLVTKLLDATGTATWSKTYNGQGDNNDVANYIAVDLSGNVYVAGYSVGLDEDKNLLLHKIDGSGNTLWTKTYTGTSGYSPDEVVGLKTDASNVYVLGSVRDSAQSYNYATIKYNSNGDTVWVRKYNNVNESDRAAALDVNASGNVAVTGRTDVNPDDTIAQYDFGTVLYNSAGVQQWATLYNSGGNNVDEPVALTLSATGNVYVSGRSQVAGVDDITTVKYNSTGVQQWAQTYNGGNGNDRNEAMVVDGNENVYVCGRTTASNGSFDGLLIKYNSSGAQQWVKTFNGAGNGEDRFDKILLDIDGNITVAGKTDVDNTAGVNFDYLVVKYDNSGNVLWDTTWAYSPTSDDAVNGLTVDNNNNIYVTGESYTGTSYSYATVVYGASPQVLVYNNNQGDDKAKAITVSGTAVYVTGGSTGSGTQYDATTIKYDLGTGIKEALANSNMQVYPNPASAYTNINITSAINDDMLLVVTDVTGKAVIKTFPRAQQQISTQGMAAGIYFVNLVQDERIVASQKLIVE
jgi:uncharacterized delta-60 repeat protein